jgi:hypothetical protein
MYSVHSTIVSNAAAARSTAAPKRLNAGSLSKSANTSQSTDSVRMKSPSCVLFMNLFWSAAERVARWRGRGWHRDFWEMKIGGKFRTFISRTLNNSGNAGLKTIKKVVRIR